MNGLPHTHAHYIYIFGSKFSWAKILWFCNHICFCYRHELQYPQSDSTFMYSSIK